MMYARVSVLTEAQQSDIAQVLASRLASAKSSLTKQATLSALETLGATAVTDSVLMAVLPSLLDTNVNYYTHTLHVCLFHCIAGGCT